MKLNYCFPLIGAIAKFTNILYDEVENVTYFSGKEPHWVILLSIKT